MPHDKSGEIAQALVRIETKLDVIIEAMLGRIGTARDARVVVSQDDVKLLQSMTTKQHATAQMLLRGATNAEIADRLGVTENTAKVHVRLLARKLKVRTRGQIMTRLMPVFEGVGDEEYKGLSGGLPKDWDANYESKPMTELIR